MTKAVLTDTTAPVDVRPPLHVHEVIEETQRLLTAATVILDGLHQTQGACRFTGAIADLLLQAEARVEAVRAWSENAAPRFAVDLQNRSFAQLVAEIGEPALSAEAGT